MRTVRSPICTYYRDRQMSGLGEVLDTRGKEGWSQGCPCMVRSNASRSNDNGHIGPPPPNKMTDMTENRSRIIEIKTKDKNIYRLFDSKASIWANQIQFATLDLRFPNQVTLGTCR